MNGNSSSHGNGNGNSVHSSAGAAVGGVNAVMQNVNAVAAAATNSLSQRYKSINGVITAISGNPAAPSANNGNTPAPAQANLASASPRVSVKPQYTGDFADFQQQTAEQQQQQQPLVNDFNFARPQSASGVRTSATSSQRPLSAYAMRR